MVYNLNEHSGLRYHSDACGSMDSKAAPYPIGHKTLMGDRSPAFPLAQQQGPTLEVQHNVFYKIQYIHYNIATLDATTKDSIARSRNLRYRRLETRKGWPSLNTIVC